MSPALTSGAIERIMNGETVLNPVLQILGIKKISGGEIDRLRLLVSDGKFFNSFAMLATQLNHMYDKGELAEFAIIRADKYITSLVNKNDSGKRVLIILELEVLQPGDQVGRKIGNPVTYTESARAAEPAAASSTLRAEAPKPPAASNNHKNGYGGDEGGGKNVTMNASINSSATMPIAGLNPYVNKWVIKVRVTSKTPIRTWNNAKGEGKLFSMDLMDESGEIRATAFKEQCDKFYDMIQPDKVYFISKGAMKPANKQFCRLNNDFELTFTNETCVQECQEAEAATMPEIKYNLKPISHIVGLEPKAVVDTIGVCKDVGELQQFTSRTTNKEFKKRDLTLVDTSNAAVSLTLWGDEAVNFDGHVQPIILVKGASVSEFNGGKSLSMGAGAVMKINPDIPECHKLRGWFDNGGAENVTTMVSARTGGSNYSSEWLSFKEAQDKNLGMGDKAEYFQVKGMVHLIKSTDAVYKACAQPDCNKKVIEEGNGYYRCEKCNVTLSEVKYRMLFNMNINDWTSNRWATVFNEVGEQLLGCSAQELGQLYSEGETAKIEEIFKTITYKAFVFKLRTKMEMYGELHRNKIIVNSISPINYKEYSRYLINSISQLTGITCNKT